MQDEPFPYLELSTDKVLCGSQKSFLAGSERAVHLEGLQVKSERFLSGTSPQTPLNDSRLHF